MVSVLYVLILWDYFPNHGLMPSSIQSVRQTQFRLNPYFARGPRTQKAQNRTASDLEAVRLRYLTSDCSGPGQLAYWQWPG